MLKVEHVSYRYPNGERDVLQDVCCTLEDGQLSAIVGPSGSGKTTLLSILAGLDSPAEGSVSIDGEDYKSLDLDRCRRERIAMIFQAFHLFPLLNVVENVCFAMELNGVAKSKAVGPAKELLEMVGIGEEKHKRYPAHLSGGEQQRVACPGSGQRGACDSGGRTYGESGHGQWGPGHGNPATPGPRGGVLRGGGDPRHVHRGSGGSGSEDEGRRPGRAGDGLKPPPGEGRALPRQ